MPAIDFHGSRALVDYESRGLASWGTQWAGMVIVA